MASIILEKEMKPRYVEIFEFVVDYVSRNGTIRGAFKEAARIFYPGKPLDIGIKRAWDLFSYALKRKRFGVRFSEFSEHYSEQDLIDESIEMNMGYYVSSHSGPVKDSSKFVKDSKANRKLFEFKKLVYAVLQDIVKPKHVLTSYVEETLRDPRLVLEISKLDENIWYNGPRYIKLPRRAAALLYLVVHRIYTKHYGAGNRPEKLFKRFFQITGYGPKDLAEELREFSSIFYDWLLFLG